MSLKKASEYLQKVDEELEEVEFEDEEVEMEIRCTLGNLIEQVDRYGN